MEQGLGRKGLSLGFGARRVTQDHGILAAVGAQDEVKGTASRFVNGFRVERDAEDCNGGLDTYVQRYHVWSVRAVQS